MFLTEDKIFLESQDQEVAAPSHNCIFELGIFTHSLGRERCFVLSPFNSETLGKIFSDYRGENRFKKIQEQDKKDKFKRIAEVIQRAIYEQGPKTKIIPLPRLTMEELTELETYHQSGGRLKKRGVILVSSSQPLELDDTSFAYTVYRNIKDNFIHYKYFFPKTSANCEQVANLIQILATVHMEGGNRDIADGEPSPEQIKNNLNLLQRYMQIVFLKSRQKIEFCVHNAQRETDAICYLRQPVDHAIAFVEWSQGRNAYEIAEDLLGSIPTDNTSQDEFINHLKTQCKALFPDTVHREVSTFIDRVCCLLS